MNLPTLPMGTLMASAMLLCGVLLALLPPGSARPGAARGLQVGLGALALLCAAWQLLWYATRHLGTGWGAAATLSGIAFVAAALLSLPRRPDARLQRLRWPAVLLLLGLGGFYGWTIARL